MLSPQTTVINWGPRNYGTVPHVESAGKTTWIAPHGPRPIVTGGMQKGPVAHLRHILRIEVPLVGKLACAGWLGRGCWEVSAIGGQC